MNFSAWAIRNPVAPLLAFFMALVIGVAWGATAGYLGGRVDNVMMRIVDILYSLPFIFFVIMLVVFFGRNFVLMFLAVGAVLWLDGWPAYERAPTDNLAPPGTPGH